MKKFQNAKIDRNNKFIFLKQIFYLKKKRNFNF